MVGGGDPPEAGLIRPFRLLKPQGIIAMVRPPNGTGGA
jgi:hypothetical protein